MRNIGTLLLTGALLASGALFAADYPSLYPAVRKSCTPAGDSLATLNPPNLQWPRRADFRPGQAGNDRYDPPETPSREDYFEVELSQSPDFSSNVIRSKPNRACFFTPRRQLENGAWYWRVSLVNDSKRIHGEINRFRIDETVPVFVAPETEALVANLPKQRPYMLAFGKSHEEVLATAKAHPELVTSIRKRGDAACRLAFENPDAIPSPAEIGFSAWLGRYTRQVRTLTDLATAYVVTGEEKYYEMGKRRIEQSLDIKTINTSMEVADRCRYLALAYDSFYHRLDPELKQRMLERIKEHLEKQYAWWPGDKESLFLENHFWQVELSGFFITALATVADCPENLKYLDYAYGIFLARAPVAGGNDGGWANGLSYFTVNNPTVGDMAYYLYAVGKVDIYQKPWFRNLPDYYLHCGFPGTPMDGFGNMHDRAYMKLKADGIGWNFGQHVLGYIDAATGNEKAKFYIAQAPQQRNPIQDLLIGRKFDYDPAKFDRSTLKQAIAFREVGVVSMHTRVTEPKEDMAVYFRSSPFGAFGHAHANQNSFNIAYKGERIFYPTGYYTSFSDPHSLSSYRHTRGHNTILVDGKGQTYGPEGFGWLKRYLHGERVTYVCGAAPNAYVPVVDPMWKKLVETTFTKEQLGLLFGDAELVKFNRHLAFLRPGVVVVYDELESKEERSWTYQLHTYQKPELPSPGSLRYLLPGRAAAADLFASKPFETVVENAFFADPRPLNPRYKDAPNQFDIRSTPKEKSRKMRFLAIIRCADALEELPPLVAKPDGSFTIGGYTIQAELDVDQPIRLSVTGNGCELQVTPAESRLAEGENIREVTPDQPPKMY